MAKRRKYFENAAANFQPKSLTRLEGVRHKRSYYLIICEGEKTEPNYFESLKTKLPRDIVSVEIAGTGRNTLSLVKFAEEKNYERKNDKSKTPYDKVWLVFDLDSFKPHFDNAIKSAESKSRKDCQWKCAWSNEAFELWYLLHFGPHFEKIGRAAYKKKLEDKLKREYKKNADDMYSVLKKYQKAAIKNAEITFKAHSNNLPPSQKNPATTVHLLVKELLSYLPQK